MNSNLDTHQKALQINLDSAKYGAIAEIGAGQEVARWFFQVGAAAGTIAKTMSAYDMGVSDAIYGKSSRYVSEDRLHAMLDHEWRLLIERLQEARGEETSFFVFADTISARNYQGTNICHGWLGVRFQSEPGGEANTICIHVNMHDATNKLQQETVGVMGVNLIYAALFLNDNLDISLASLLDDLSLDKIDVDYLFLEGPLFSKLSDREVPLLLLKNQLTHAVGFSPDGKAKEPMSLFYKAPVIIERGAFRRVEKVHQELMERAAECFVKEGFNAPKEAVEIFELTMTPSNESEAVSTTDVLVRIENLLVAKRPILVTTYGEGYHLTKFLRRYTSEPVRFAMGLSQLMQIFSESHYKHLPGGIVEAISRMISIDVSLYVYPMPVQDLRSHLARTSIDLLDWQLPDSGLAALSNVQPLDAVRHLYSYSFETGALLPLKSE